MNVPTSIKVGVARALSSPVVGLGVGFLSKDRVRSMGVPIDTSPEGFTPSVKAQLFFSIYESAEIRFIRKYLRGASWVIELGSSLGVTASHILDVKASDGLLCCVEANPLLLETLRVTVAAAERRTGKKATVVHGAVGGDAAASDGQVCLRVGRSSLSSRLADRGQPAGPEIAVPAISLSSLVQGWDDYALVSDTEGAEAWMVDDDSGALRGASIMVIEVHDSSTHRRTVRAEQTVETLTSAHGFTLLDRNGRVVVLGRAKNRSVNGRSAAAGEAPVRCD